MPKVIKEITQVRETNEPTYGTKYPDDTQNSQQENSATVFARLIYLAVSIILGLLAIRLLLVLLGANRLNGFADFIYSVTDKLVSPFFGLFNYQTNYGQGRFEYETIFAMIAYALIGWVIIRLLTITDDE